ncbi:MAG: ankyrin repeat domain-containing protein [Gammaproteobacteria bacterium]|jgi:ankyrin repeat protein
MKMHKILRKLIEDYFIHHSLNISNVNTIRKSLITALSKHIKTLKFYDAPAFKFSDPKKPNLKEFTDELNKLIGNFLVSQNELSTIINKIENETKTKKISSDDDLVNFLEDLHKNHQKYLDRLSPQILEIITSKRPNYDLNLLFRQKIKLTTKYFLFMALKSRKNFIAWVYENQKVTFDLGMMLQNKGFPCLAKKIYQELLSLNEQEIKMSFLSKSQKPQLAPMFIYLDFNKLIEKLDHNACKATAFFIEQMAESILFNKSIDAWIHFHQRSSEEEPFSNIYTPIENRNNYNLVSKQLRNLYTIISPIYNGNRTFYDIWNNNLVIKNCFDLSNRLAKRIIEKLILSLYDKYQIVRIKRGEINGRIAKMIQNLYFLTNSKSDNLIARIKNYSRNQIIDQAMKEKDLFVGKDEKCLYSEVKTEITYLLRDLAFLLKIIYRTPTKLDPCTKVLDDSEINNYILAIEAIIKGDLNALKEVFNIKFLTCYITPEIAQKKKKLNIPFLGAEGWTLLHCAFDNAFIGKKKKAYVKILEFLYEKIETYELNFIFDAFSTRLDFSNIKEKKPLSKYLQSYYFYNFPEYSRRRINTKLLSSSDAQKLYKKITPLYCLSDKWSDAYNKLISKYHLGSLLIEKREYKQARDNFKFIIDVYEKNNQKNQRAKYNDKYLNLVAKSYYFLGICNFRLNKPSMTDDMINKLDNASRYIKSTTIMFRRAMQVAKKIKSKTNDTYRFLSSCYCTLSAYYRQKAQNGSAVKSLCLARKLLEEALSTEQNRTLRSLDFWQLRSIANEQYQILYNSSVKEGMSELQVLVVSLMDIEMSAITPKKMFSDVIYDVNKNERIEIMENILLWSEFNKSLLVRRFGTGKNYNVLINKLGNIWEKLAFERVYEKVINLNQKVKDKLPLQIAMEANNAKAVTLLLKYGADINKLKDFDPIQWAIDNNHHKIVTLFVLKGFKIDYEFKTDYYDDSSPRNLLDYAIQQNNSELINILLSKQHKVDRINIKNLFRRYNKDNEKILYKLLKKHHHDIFKEIFVSLSMLCLLSNQNSTGYKEKYHAIEKFARYLINNLKKWDININMQLDADDAQNSALHLMVQCGNKVMIKELMLKGANIKLKNYYDQIPVELAMKNNIRNMLCDEYSLYLKIEKLCQAKDEKISDEIKALVKKVNINKPFGKRFNTVLHLTATSGKVRYYKYLLLHGADITYLKKDGKWGAKKYPELANIMTIRKNIITAFKYTNAFCKQFVEKKVDLDLNKILKGKIQMIPINSLFKGQGLLHIAVKSNWKELVKLLMDLNADPQIKNKDGKTSLDICKNNEIKILLENKTSRELPQNNIKLKM